MYHTIHYDFVLIVLVAITGCSAKPAAEETQENASSAAIPTKPEFHTDQWNASNAEGSMMEEAVEEIPKQVDCENKANPHREQSEQFEEAVQLPQAASDESTAQKDSDAESPKMVILGWRDYSIIDVSGDGTSEVYEHLPISGPEAAVYVYNGEEIGKGYKGFVAMMERLKQLPKSSEIILYQNDVQGYLYVMDTRVIVDNMPPFRTTTDYWNAFVRLIQDRDFQTWEMPYTLARFGIPTDRFASEQEFVDKFPDWRKRELKYANGINTNPPQSLSDKIRRESYKILKMRGYPIEVPTEIIGPLIRVNYTLGPQNQQVRLQK